MLTTLATKPQQTICNGKCHVKLLQVKITREFTRKNYHPTKDFLCDLLGFVRWRQGTNLQRKGVFKRSSNHTILKLQSTPCGKKTNKFETLVYQFTFTTASFKH